MSQLIDKLQKSSKASPQPMGFGAARTTVSTPRLVLIAEIDASEAGVPDWLASIADGIALKSGKTKLAAKAVQTLVESLKNVPWGVEMNATEKKAGVFTGADFTIMPADGPVAAAPRDEKHGRILQVDTSMDDGLLRAVNDLPVEAVVVADSHQGALVWHQMMVYRHLANLLSKPVIVPVAADISAPELEALWKAGIDGIIVPAGESDTEALKNLRQAIDKLPPRTVPKRGKEEARLPRLGGETAPVSPGHEEDDEDDDEDY